MSTKKFLFSSHTQYVSRNNTKFESLSINYGVAKGSVFGPLLFLIYINDLSNGLNKSSDDATIYTKHKNTYLLCNILTIDLKNVIE